MVITHNMTAANAERQVGINNKLKTKSMEKLSSGYKINRAGDNAAGLAVSEKMRDQIRGLDQASRNMEDGISLVQTADGAMQEIHNILQRERELSVQAANDTNTDEDRLDIQKEIDNLSREITRISEQTEFNTRKVLQGKKEKTVIIETPISINDLEQKESFQTASMPEWVTDSSTKTTLTGNLTEDVWSSTVYSKTTMYYDAVKGTWQNKGTEDLQSQRKKNESVSGAYLYERIDSGNGAYDQVRITYQDGKTETKSLSSISDYTVQKYLNQNINSKVRYDYQQGGTRSGAYLDLSNLNKDNVFDLINDKYPQAFNSTCCTCDARYSVTFVNGGGNKIETSGQHKIYSVDISDVLDRAKAGKDVTGEEVVDKILGALLLNGTSWDKTTGEVEPNGHYSIYGKDENNKNCLVIYDYRKFVYENQYAKEGGQRGKFEWGIYTESGYSNSIQVSVSRSEVVTETKDWIRIQTGANAGQELAIDLPEISLEELGISELNVSKHDDAGFSMDRIDNAIDYVSGERARMGAYQNRMEYAVSRVDIASENLSIAESRIRDTDIADEMTGYAKVNILSQAGEAMLANANRDAQNVLGLLGS